MTLNPSGWSFSTIPLPHEEREDEVLCFTDKQWSRGPEGRIEIDNDDSENQSRDRSCSCPYLR